MRTLSILLTALWLAALLGMMIKYSEVVLSIRFRERDAKGDWVGGPMYYVKNGLGKGWQWVGILFAVFAAIACFGIGNMSQVNSIVGSLNDAIDAFIPAAEGERKLLNFIFGLVIAGLIGVILFGGIKRIGAVAEKLVPVMSILYIIFAFVVIFGHAGNIGPAFAKIFRTAFTPKALGGAASGIALKQTIVWGLRRSAFSNEAGLGTGSIAHGWAPVGAMQFDFTLAPGCSTDFILGLGYIENPQDEKFTAPDVINKTRADAMHQRYDTNAQFDAALDALRRFQNSSPNGSC